MDIEAKRAAIKKWGRIGLVALAGFIVAPAIFIAIQGLIGLVIAGIISATIVTFTPWATMKFANWRVKAIVAEAKENPIETMINLIVANEKAFDVFKDNVTKSAAARDTFKQKCEIFSKNYPARAPEFQAQLTRMSELVERKKLALKQAQASLNEGKTKLDEMKAYWEMSKTAIELNKAAGMDTGDVFEKLKADTACDAVFSSMNTAFAQLEVASALEIDMKETPAALTHSEPLTIDVPVREAQKVRV